MTHHLGGHPPTNNESIPPTLGWCGTKQPTGISKRTRDQSTHRPRRTTSPPTTERWSHGWRVKSKRPPTPTTPLNYTNTQHRHSRRHYNESDGHPPPPPGTQHTRITCSIVSYTWHLRGTITRSNPDTRGTWPRHTTPNPPGHIRVVYKNTKTPLTVRIKYDHSHRCSVPPMQHGQLCVLPLHHVQVFCHTPTGNPRLGTTTTL